MNVLPKSWMTKLLLALVFFTTTLARAEDVSAAFNSANKLYEQGRFSEAAAGYEKLITNGTISPQIYFNLGNAFLKSGQIGRSIVAYRAAEKLSPRDPDIRSNLQFAREQASGGANAAAIRWESWIGHLTLNEWTVLASLFVAIFFLLLAMRQWRANWRNSFRGLLAAVGVASVFLLACLGVAIKRQMFAQSAVVIVSEAVVRPGPFEESQSAFTLRDGAEVSVIGRKDAWLEISDPTGRTGWVPSRNVTLLGNVKS